MITFGINKGKLLTFNYFGAIFYVRIDCSTLLRYRSGLRKAAMFLFASAVCVRNLMSGVVS